MGPSWGRRLAARPVSSPVRQDRCKVHRITTVQRHEGQALLPLQQPLPTIAIDPSREKRRMKSRKTREE
ncbi:hypothetical protein CHARACLAT_014934 [Characodon lateralis]|uniref:Uncharacterized protein n=1 Tax=Characodon lateralis TaxID=208331 RepID=A0ABU7CSD3_9TELE|nr:hypothetical protein [Characodon lateralis]